MEWKRPSNAATEEAVKVLLSTNARLRNDETLKELCTNLSKQRAGLDSSGSLEQRRRRYATYLALVHRAEQELGDRDVALPFTWTDSHAEHEEQTQTSWDFELAAVLFNLAVITMLLGDACPISQCEEAREYWQRAAGMFSHISEHYAPALVEEGIHATLCFQSWLADELARRQACTDALHTCDCFRPTREYTLPQPLKMLDTTTRMLAAGLRRLYNSGASAFALAAAGQWRARVDAFDKLSQAVVLYELAESRKALPLLKLACLRSVEALCKEATDDAQVERAPSWESHHLRLWAGELLPSVEAEMSRTVFLHWLRYPRWAWQMGLFFLAIAAGVPYLCYVVVHSCWIPHLAQHMSPSWPRAATEILHNLGLILAALAFWYRLPAYMLHCKLKQVAFKLGEGEVVPAAIPYTPPVAGQRMKVCVVCMDKVRAAKGLCCKSAEDRAQHFHCSDCVEQYAVSELAGARVAVGDLRCSLDREGMEPRCRAEPWSFTDIQAHVSKETLTDLLKAASEAAQSLSATVERQRLLLQQKGRDEQHLLQAELQGAARLQRAERLLKMKHSIIEAVAYLRCPRCTAVYQDYDGCIALKCGNPGCDAAFCAMCLEDCGADAHPHTLAKHGSHFISVERVQEEHKQRRQALLQSAIDGLVNEDAGFKRELLAQLEADVRDIGLDVSAVRVAADVRPAAVPVQMQWLPQRLARLATVAGRQVPVRAPQPGGAGALALERPAGPRFRGRLVELDADGHQELYRAQLAATLGRALHARELALDGESLQEEVLRLSGNLR